MIQIKPWQRDVLAIIRDESYYFAPQAQTKIMNEGWATYWHSTIMTRQGLAPADLICYCDHHSGTMATSPGRLNPYKLGVELFRDIEDRWNRGRFGKEYEQCDDLSAKRRWDTAGRKSSTSATTDALAAASPAGLQKISHALAARLTYLLEPISPIEVDEERCVVQMRSNPPQRDEAKSSYYELLVRRGGEISLCRYEKPPPQPAGPSLARHPRGATSPGRRFFGGRAVSFTPDRRT